MSEQDNSPETNTNSPKSPSTPEKKFSLSKIIDSIILFAFGTVFIASLFSKDKNTENKELPIENREENAEAHKEDKQHQKTEKQGTEITSLSSGRMSKLRDFTSNINEKIKEKMHKNIFKDAYNAIPVELRKKVFISFTIFFILFIITNWWTEILNGISPAFKYLFLENMPLGISISAAIIVAFSLISGKTIVTETQKRFSSLTNKYFIATLAGLAVLGASSALLIPSYTTLFRNPEGVNTQLDSTKENKEKSQDSPAPSPSSTDNKAAEVEQKTTSDLRLHFLYITGGIIAILGLIETNRKNSQDHIRQVHAARRDRYIEAVDKLSSKQAPVRLGGVYALIGLIDEWLDDENIAQETRVKEGQIIVNNLCAYIRSPFHLVSKLNLLEADTAPANYGEEKFTKNQAELREELDIRRTIFAEIVKHIKESNSPNKLKITDRKSNTNIENWKALSFNFNKAPIFYELNVSAYENLSFAGAIFYIKPSFEFATFNNSVNFRSAHFTKGVYFYGTKFKKSADFSNARFKKFADFRSAHFSSIHTNFESARFEESADFSLAIFSGITDFSSTHFHKKAEFIGAHFEEYASFALSRIHLEASFSSTIFQNYIDFSSVHFEGPADFYSVKFKGKTNFESAHFKESAYFRSVKFIGKTNFKSAHFEGSADFYSVKFKGKTNFKSAHFEEFTDFYSVKFKGKTNFKSAHFEKLTYFDSAHFIGKTNFNKTIFDISSPYFSIDSCNYAIFSYLTNPKKYIFTVSSGSAYSITTEKIIVADGRIFTIPVGCQLFDPEPLPALKPKEKPAE